MAEPKSKPYGLEDMRRQVEQDSRAAKQKAKLSAVATRIHAINPYQFISNPNGVADLSKEDARLLVVAYQDLAAKLSVVQAALAMRLAEPDPPAEQDRVLTISEVATWLGRKDSYVSELVRKRRIPAVEFPSPAGKGSKYSGVLLSKLKAWVRAHEDAGIR